MQVIEAFNQNGLYFLLFALCLDADSIPETTRFVVGRRTPRSAEIRPEIRPEMRPRDRPRLARPAETRCGSAG